MRSRLRLVGAGVVAGALVAVAAAPAQAATSGRIESITSDNGKLQIVFAGVGVPAGASIDPSSVKLMLDGQAVDAKAAPLGTSSSVKRTAVLAIDTSGSMAGAGITGAKAAALKFLSVVPSDVRVGLVTFSTQARLAIPATTDRNAVRNRIGALRATGNTALYDAVDLALRTTGSSGVRSVILLTDGTDDGSRLSLDEAVAKVKGSGAALDAVAFRTAAARNGALDRLTAAAKGHVVAASQTQQITDAFNTVAQDIARQIVITAAVPTSLSGKSGTVAVSASVGGQTITDTAAASFGTAEPTGGTGNQFGPKPVSDSGGLSTTWAVLAALLLFVGLALILAVAATSVTTETRRAGVRRRLSIYTLTGRVAREHEEEQSALGTSAIARSAIEFAGRVVQSRDFETGLARRLDAAALPLRPAEWMLIHVGTALALGIVLLIATGSFLAGIIGVIIGVVGPLLLLTVREERRRAAFLAQLPDTLQLIAGSLSAGYSMPQAIDTVVKEGAPAVASEFNRVLVETRLGMPIEDALEGVAHRMRSVDFAWVVMAIRIQREVGGNLAEVLTTVAETLRERERIRRQVDVLSAEGRLSALILGGLPPLFAVYLILVRREYIQVLWHESAGIAMLVLAAILLTVGGFWLRKVVRVEV